MHVVATAGHVDHGKSTLVHALTGMDPDRFEEEKRRGLTIDLGFAWAMLPSGRELAFVDVPGHVRFIKNMLAGVGAVDACLFVVAATEGWKPQSEEHLRILELLGIRHGMVALTKVALVDNEWLAMVHAEVTERLSGTFLEGADVVDVDAPAKRGIEELRDALDRLLGSTPRAADRDRPRLWVDRVFAAKGAGTVVTGTLAGGTVAVDDDLVVEPGGTRVRVRGLQNHQRAVSTVGPGHRVAANLTGVAHGAVERGHALVRPRQWATTGTVDCSLDVLSTLDHDVSRRGAYRAYIGSGEYPVSLRVLGDAAIPPGGSGWVRLHLAATLPLVPGDRYVLRESGRGETVGGGEVLDVAPVLPASKARPSHSVERIVAERGWVDVDELERLTGARRTPTLDHWVVDPEALDGLRAELRAAVADAAGRGLDIASLDPRRRLVLDTIDDVVVDQGRARLAGVDEDDLAAHPWLAALTAAPFTPPPPDGVDKHDVRELVRRGLVVERDGTYFAVSAVDAAARTVARLLKAAPDGVTVAAVRDALGTSRKHVLPLLSLLDATGVTRRRDDLRIAGPRLPDAGVT